MSGNATRIARLLETYGLLYSEELGIDLARNTPSALFRWLCASILYSARIPASNATRAAKALSKAGWRTPSSLAASSWEERVKVLNENGYARYDESTSRMLGDVAADLLSDYGGDLRRLREDASRVPAEERQRLKAFKGLGDVGVGIFCREVQLVWEELYPFADRKALAGARKLDLGETAEDLARLVDKDQFPVLVAALVRMELAGKADDIAG